MRSVISQFRQPTGALGRLAGWEMATRSSNRKRNEWAVELLDVRPTDRVLEVGFGPGIAIRAIARRATSGRVVGIDHSQVMVREATRRNREGMREGRVDLRLGTIEALPAFEESFDKALSVNSIMFWDDPVLGLTELRGLLREGGVIAIVRQPRGPGARTTSTDEVIAEVRGFLKAAGFVDVRTEVLHLKPAVVCGLGVNPAT